MSHERWREIPNTGGNYDVSDLGRVRSRKWGNVRLLKPYVKNQGGHLAVTLSYDGVIRRMYVHRLVLSVFTGGDQRGLEVRHKNGVPSDNRLENLQWGSRSDNVRDEVEAGRFWQLRKEYCPAGHAYSPENTLVKTHQRRSGGRANHRVCRTCYNANRRKRRAEYRSAKLGTQK